MMLFLFICAIFFFANVYLKKKFQPKFSLLKKGVFAGIISYPMMPIAMLIVLFFVAGIGQSIVNAFAPFFCTDTYISWFGNGWLGTILQFIREIGLIGEITEPECFVEFRAAVDTAITASLICAFVSLVFTVFYFVMLGKQNKTLMLAMNYANINLCVISSFYIGNEFWAFSNMTTNVGLDLSSVVKGVLIVCLVGIFIAIMIIKDCIAITSRKYNLKQYTWNDLLKPIKIELKSIVYIEGKHIVYILLGIDIILILSGLLVANNSNPTATVIEADSRDYQHDSIDAIDQDLNEQSCSTNQVVSTATDKTATMILHFYDEFKYYMDSNRTNDERAYWNEHQWDICSSRFYAKLVDCDFLIWIPGQDWPDFYVSVSKYELMDNAYKVQLWQGSPNLLFSEMIWIMVDDVERGLLLDNIIYTSNGSEYNEYINTNKPYVDYSLVVDDFSEELIFTPSGQSIVTTIGTCEFIDAPSLKKDINGDGKIEVISTSLFDDTFELHLGCNGNEFNIMSMNLSNIEDYDEIPIQISSYDFDKDGVAEILFAIGTEDYTTLFVYRVDLQMKQSYRLVRLKGAGKMFVNENNVSIVILEQDGSREEYQYKDGLFIAR